MLFILLNSGSTAIAKEKKATSKNKSVASQKYTDNSPHTPFDINTEKLPPNFTGTDIVKLYNTLLVKVPLKKDEFETADDYEKKIMAIVKDDVYTFKLDPDIWTYGLKVHPYDAESQDLKIDINTFSLNEYMSTASIIVKNVAGTVKSNIGSNAFGVKVLVKKYTGKQYGIALTNENDFGTSEFPPGYIGRYSGHRKMSFTFAIPPDKARTLKNNIRVLLLCKLRPDRNELIFKDAYIVEPTIDEPQKLVYDRKYINVEMLSVWVYEVNTGTILLKKQLKTEKE